MNGVVAQARLENLLDMTLLEGFPPSFRFEVSDGSARYTENAIAKKLCSFVKGIYSISVWGVKNCHDREVFLRAEEFLEEDEVGKLQKAELAAYGRTKLVTIETTGVKENGESSNFEQDGRDDGDCETGKNRGVVGVVVRRCGSTFISARAEPV